MEPAEKFRKMVLENSDKYYGLCPPPMKAQDGLDILIKHFLGEDWYFVLPVSQEQINTEAVYEILQKYPRPGRREHRIETREALPYWLERAQKIEAENRCLRKALERIANMPDDTVKFACEDGPVTMQGPNNAVYLARQSLKAMEGGGD